MKESNRRESDTQKKQMKKNVEWKRVAMRICFKDHQTWLQHRTCISLKLHYQKTVESLILIAYSS